MIVQCEAGLHCRFRCASGNRPAERSPAGLLFEKVCLSQFAPMKFLAARGTSRVFASGCCRPIHRGIGPAFNTLSMERTNGCEEEEGYEEGRRQEKEVGTVRCVARKPAHCAGFLVFRDSRLSHAAFTSIGSPLISSSME